ncbi:expressed unknown protein [Seminavis robusta]|uniref:Uncharacterized protein n=1 Tax=Seminavis robusta TaxID=568900 RepID=A0A9N8HGW4_9STRA|nr:expressed unknown protein [Seminavis robusta]|eukprot:Sro600_g173420.1 n/a (319) ;mRNA; r:46356-47312
MSCSTSTTSTTSTLPLNSSTAISKMENNLRSVALSNTKGIHALVMGRKKCVSRALTAFKSALTELEDTMATSSCNHCCQMTTAARLEVFNSSAVTGLPALTDELPFYFYLYNRAIYFCPLSDTTTVGLTFYKCVLHFNMALAHHVKANNSTTSSGDAKAIKSAIKYYKQCLRALSHLGVSGDRPPFPGGGEAMVYLRLAALNNLAHVQTLAGDSESSQKTLARVFKFTLAQRPFLFNQKDQATSSSNSSTTGSTSTTQPDGTPMEDCSSPQNNANPNNDDRDEHSDSRRANNTMNSEFVNEVLLNVMVSGPIAGAAAA